MNIYALNTVVAGIDSLRFMQKELKFDGIIGLTPRKATDAISGYVDMQAYCELNGLKFIPVESYSLKSPADKTRLLSEPIDVLIILGWQRLIPSWLIDHCKTSVVGGHGSHAGIHGGRGRSPQNWAIMLNMNEFSISIFEVDPGIDSGRVIDSRTYTLSEHDDIRSSYYKSGWLQAQMVIENLRNGNIGKRQGQPQNKNARYLPQRKPEDGQIDWSRSPAEITRFIRALTSPYPGAFSPFESDQLKIWKARPFEFPLNLTNQTPGQIVRVFYDGSIVVNAGTGLVLIEEYELSSETKLSHTSEGKVLESADYSEQMKKIITRHQEKYPDLVISDDILNESR